MNKVAILVPHISMVEYTKETVSGYKDVHVEYCNAYYQVDTAKRLYKEGYKVIITRPGITNRIKKALPYINIVELSITSLDIIKSLQEAKKHGNNIGIVSYFSPISGIDYLTEIMDVSVKQYLNYSEDDNYKQLEDLVLQTIRDGLDVIVGGGIFCEFAKNYGMPAVLIKNSRESILIALEEAMHILEAIEVETVKRRLFEVVLDNVHDGIISLDSQNNITSINLKAQKIFNTTLLDSFERKVSDIFPDLEISEILKDDKKEIEKILYYNHLKLLCNKIPIEVNEKLHGSLLVFQDITKIQKLEARVRKEIYNKGNFAQMKFSDVLGSSQSTMQSINLAKRYASTDSNILILGDTGTGKEVFSQSIHNHSPRSSGPFIVVNCAALPENILESELFGYVDGAFTGAKKEGRPGLFELAHGGTIFLDEISEMDYSNQSRLLRVLQEKSIRRLGSDTTISIDIRVIAASNKNLRDLILSKEFREDLYFRLNVLKLELPPLRDRKQDIKDIAQDYLNDISLKAGKKLTLSASAIKSLEKYNWPGNVRELHNTMERLLSYCESEIIKAADVAAVIEKWNSQPSISSIYDNEIQEIANALIKANGVKTKAAELLGIDRTTLWRKMRNLDIKL